MRIGDMPRLGTAALRKKGKTSENAGVFSLDEDKETAASGASALGASSNTQSTSALSSFYSPLLTLQEEKTDEEKSIQKGTVLLNDLETLQRESLSGAYSEQTLSNLKTGLLSAQEGHSPRLRSILEAIETRAAVELAKRGQISEKDL